MYIKNKRVYFNCEICGKEHNQIQSEYNRNKHHYCSIECRQLAKGYSVEVQCEHCGKTFKKGKYDYEHSTHHFCSRECKDKHQEKEIEFTCDYCGKTSTMIPYRFDRSERHFCSNECKNKYQDGKNHPRYDETISDEDRINKRQYQEYYDFIDTVLKRDNYTCQLSGQVGGKLVVHHLNGYHWFKEGRVDPNNAITLSEEVHKMFHDIYGRTNNTKEQFEDFIEKYFKEVS